jgi:hypothetical protein
MIKESVDSHIHFKHSPGEVERLSQAIIPMAEHIAAVGSPYERGTMRRILNGKYFRQRDAAMTHAMLIRASKYCRAHLADYFPLMREGLLAQSQELEEAANEYWHQFQIGMLETQPTH